MKDGFYYCQLNDLIYVCEDNKFLCFVDFLDRWETCTPISEQELKDGFTEYVG
jgi:hypothetical protein